MEESLKILLLHSKLNMSKTKAQIKGAKCERSVKSRLKKRCPILIDLPKGADSLCINNDGISFHEMKSAKSKLTAYQRKYRDFIASLGIPYYVHRCDS